MRANTRAFYMKAADEERQRILLNNVTSSGNGTSIKIDSGSGALIVDPAMFDPPHECDTIQRLSDAYRALKQVQC